MTEFRVGDEVEIIASGWGFLPENIGKIVKITNILSETHCICKGLYSNSVNFKCLKLIRRAGMKYKVGDKFKRDCWENAEIISVNEGFYHCKDDRGNIDHYTDKELEKYTQIFPEPQVKEVTMNEIADKFGIDVKTLKIKKD